MNHDDNKNSNNTVPLVLQNSRWVVLLISRSFELVRSSWGGYPSRQGPLGSLMWDHLPEIDQKPLGFHHGSDPV